MDEMDNIENRYNEEVRCPHCGKFQVESWELDDEGITWCDFCEKDIKYTRHVSVTYSSEKVEATNYE